MRKVIIFSGAGLSVESGISTYREKDGLWENYKIEEICDITTWKKNKEKVFNFYNERRDQVKNVEPSAGHKMIAELQAALGVDNVINITQNIDDLLERAGVQNVLHIHGSLLEQKCQYCGKVEPLNGKNMDIDDICPHCGSKDIKPNVVFFGEDAPGYHFMKRIFRDVTKDDVVLVIGTMGNVVPINLHMQTTYGFKILNNLEKSKYIDERLFQKVFYDKIGNIHNEILNLIKSKVKI